MHRFPRIVVMLDEMGGDGTGAPSVHAIAQWLDDQFIAPFGDHPPRQAAVTLVIADASLGNEKIMENYLTAPGSGDAAPEKILITPSSGEAAFQLAVARFKVGPVKPEVLHVMTNSFPAATLHVRYAWKLHRLQPMERPDGAPMSNRDLIRNQKAEKLLNSAAAEVLASVPLRDAADHLLCPGQELPEQPERRPVLTRAGTGNRTAVVVQGPGAHH